MLFDDFLCYFCVIQIQMIFLYFKYNKKMLKFLTLDFFRDFL